MEPLDPKAELMRPVEARFSPCGKYRYTLPRLWDDRLPLVVYIGRNPSTATTDEEDNTSRRFWSFAQGFGYGGYITGNLNAYIATDPDAMLRAADPCGPENDAVLMEITSRLDIAIVIACWGAVTPMEARRARTVIAMLTRPLECFGTTKAGFPKHPLYLRGDTQLERYWTPRNLTVDGKAGGT